jgi:hypothetical protein
MNRPAAPAIPENWYFNARFQIAFAGEVVPGVEASSMQT